jgi:histidine triad (HIT) family protein
MPSHAPADYRCPFCRIARGEVMPRNAGNALIVPRGHYENIYEMPDDLLAQVIVTAKRIAVAMKTAYGCDGTSLRQHNEPAGSQEM